MNIPYRKILMFAIVCYLIVACSNTNKAGIPEDTSSSEKMEAEENFISKTGEDTTVHKIPYYTAELDDAIEYFRKNNRYKDWPKNDPKTVIIKCIAEKDSTISDIRIFRNGSGSKDLDEEAKRLIRNTKISPAMNEYKKAIRSEFMILVNFPPK